MQIKDEGHEETEELLKKLEKEITKEYQKASKEVSAKLRDYLRRFEAKDKIKKEALEKGLISEVAGNQLWQDMLKKRRKLGYNTFSDFLRANKSESSPL